MPLAAGGQPAFPPHVAAHLIKLACQLPEQAGRSLSLGTCAELARTLQHDGLVQEISAQSVQRILRSQKLKPWRVHYWLSPKTPRDAAFREQTRNICDLYRRPLLPHEVVLSLDEKTSIQPRPRIAKTEPAQPDGVPIRVEHSYKRDGALNLLAAFDTRSGRVIGICRRRKRQIEFIELPEEIDRQSPSYRMKVGVRHDRSPGPVVTAEPTMNTAHSLPATMVRVSVALIPARRGGFSQ